ncbi:MAG: sigma 54-interacting transcriptional regulator [Spirochaetales bacterium]|nr:sigma 54-interacting transcriptional regulator [Spirochaetales bacterium]
MEINRDEFFREAAILITGHLDIRKALHKAFLYIRNFIPADAIHLELFSMKEGTARMYASAWPEKSEKSGKTIHLPPEAAQHLAPALEDPDTVHIINDVDKNPIGALINKAFGQSGNSVLACPLYIETHVLGGLIIEKTGKNAYTPEHAGLARLLIKPFSIALANCLKHDEILRLNEIITSDKNYLQREILQLAGDRIIGADFGLKEVMEKVKQVSSTSSPVLLLGETGVGKDIIANAIHYSSSRKDMPFIKVNSGAIPESLIDSELFGHEKGAFTGADRQKRGRFERADKGSLFLDEIGELPANVQVRLLRVLQNREFERVGGAEPVSIDVRIIAATHQDLESMIKNGKFREDLWFRINVFPIIIPPLRERKQDIPSLVNHFIHKKSIELKKNDSPAIDAASLRAMIDYSWPGNVRELENVIERAMILHRDGPLYINAETPEPGQIPCAGNTTAPALQTGNIITPLDRYTAEYISKVLQHAGGKIHGPDGAAALLGIKPTTLRYKMDRLGVSYKKHNKKKACSPAACPD